eukprot:gene6119-7624_t
MFSFECGFIVECPSAEACYNFIVYNYIIDKTDLISILYEQGSTFTNCNLKFSPKTSIYISVAGAQPAIITCDHTKPYLTIDSSDILTPSNYFNVTIEGIEIYNTTSKTDGSVVNFFGSNPGTIYLNQVVFTNGLSQGNGGFVSTPYSLDVRQSQFYFGKAVGSGGAFSVGQTISTHDTTIVGCMTKGSGGVISASTAIIATSKFYDNSAAFNGGSMICTSCYVFFSTISRNTAAMGGAIYSQSGTIQIGSVSFVENKAHTGGAINFYNITGSITTSNFTSNSATYGGAMSLQYFVTPGAIEFLDSYFNHNYAELEGGGALYISSSTVHNPLYHGQYFNNSSPTFQCDDESEQFCNVHCTVKSCQKCAKAPCLINDNHSVQCFDKCPKPPPNSFDDYEYFGPYQQKNQKKDIIIPITI